MYQWHTILTKMINPWLKSDAPTSHHFSSKKEHVRSMAEHLPRICDALYRDEYYICISQDGRFRMNTAGSYRVARMYIDKKWMAFKLEELRYLSYIFSWFTINSSDTQKH
jgi:hypothetical protein